MNPVRQFVWAVAAGWSGRLMSMALNLVLTPVLFQRLVAEEVGFWFLLVQAAALVALTDLGFSATLTRRIALAAGASDAVRSREVAALAASARAVYRTLAAAAFLLSWTAGGLFLRGLRLTELPAVTVWTAWTVVCLGQAATLWAGLWSCLLSGLGYVGWETAIATGVNALAAGAQIVVVLAGGGVVSLAVASAIGAAAAKGCCYALLRAKGLKFRGGRAGRAMIREMAPTALRAWLTALGAVLILRTQHYFIAYFRGMADIPAFQAAYQLTANLNLLAVSFGTASSVLVSQLWRAGELEKIHAIVERNLRLGLTILVAGGVLLAAAGEELFALWLGPGHFAGYRVLLTFWLMLALEAQHVIVSSASRATEDEVFAPWALAGGLLNLAFIGALIGPLGLWGVALGTCLAQLLTNNWYAVYRGFHRLRMSAGAYLRRTAAPLAATAAAAYACACLAGYAGEQWGGAPGRVLGAAAAAGAICLASAWTAAAGLLGSAKSAAGLCPRLETEP